MLLLLLSNLGFAAGAGTSVPEVAAAPPTIGGGFIFNFRERLEELRKKKRLEEELARKRAELLRIAEQKQAVQEKPRVRPEGILANLHKLEVKESRVEAAIETLQLKIAMIDQRIFDEAISRKEDDDDFEDMMILQ